MMVVVPKHHHRKFSGESFLSSSEYDGSHTIRNTTSRCLSLGNAKCGASSDNFVISSVRPSLVIYLRTNILPGDTGCIFSVSSVGKLNTNLCSGIK
jgi:hypothetical protein